MSIAIVVAALDEPRRTAIVAALERLGLSTREPGRAEVRIEDAGEEVAIAVDGTRVRFSGALGPDDVASAARLAVALASARAELRAFGEDASVGLVASMCAHDIRNLLVPIRLAADALLARGDLAVTPDARLVAEGCDSIAAIANRLRSVPPAALPPIDVNAVIQGAVPTLSALVGARARLSTRLERPLPLVEMDPVDLERALVNLVGNARDASPPGGRIVVATSMQTDADDSRWVVVEVEDHGGGMDEATRARALEPFFTTKGESGGTGLGLASVARAVAAAGGRIEVDSAPGRGTRVMLCLPTKTSS